MPGEDDVLINFVGKTDELQPAEDVLDAIIAKGGKVGEAWKKTSETINTSTKQNVDNTSKLAKAIDNMATATKSMDKAVIGGAYKNYLKELQAQLGLTNKELISYLQNARKAAQEAIFSAQTQQEADELTLSIQVMNDQLEVLQKNEETTGQATLSLRTRLKEAKEELVRLADAGITSGPAFEAARKKAGELDDQMRDLNTAIKGTGSDTRKIDGLISLASGVAGGFAVAQGAIALFGGESEDVQRALVKVNAAMSILQGLQAIQNILQKESAASLLLQTTATEGATVATQGLNVAMKANPVGLLIVGITALFTAISIFGDSEGDASEKTKALNELLLEQFNRAQDLADFYEDEFSGRLRRVFVDLAKAQADGSGKAKILALQLDELNSKALQNQERFNSSGGATYLDKLSKELISLSYDLDQFGTDLSKSDQKRKDAIQSQFNLAKAQFTAQKKLVTDYYDTNVELEAKLLEIKHFSYEQDVKSAVAAEDAKLARRKIAILRNQTDSIASIEAVANAEIAAINKKAEAEKDKTLNPNLTAGEIEKIEADAALKVLEVRRQLEVKKLEIRKSGINAELLLAQKGSLEEYKAKLKLLDAEQKIELLADEVTQEKAAEIRAKYFRERQAALRAFMEAQLQDQISGLNAELDEFGISERKKLNLTIERLDIQRELEISQAEGNAAKIKEINVKYDKQAIEEKRKFYDQMYTLWKKQYDLQNATRISDLNDDIDNNKKSIKDRRDAINELEAIELKAVRVHKMQLMLRSIDDKNYQKEYANDVQELDNLETQIKKKGKKDRDALNELERQNMLEKFKSSIDFFQNGLSAVLGSGSLFGTAITEMENFAFKAKDIFKQMKDGAITTIEGIKAIAAAAISSAQAVINQIFADASARRQQIAADEIASLEEQKQRELNVKNLTEQQKADIDTRYRQREKVIKRQAFEADKQAKRSQALINGALAATLAFAEYVWPYNLIVAAITAGLTAVEISEINRQQPPAFKKGGYTGNKGENDIAGVVHGKEFVTTAKQTEKHRDILEAIHNDRLDHYLIHKFSDFIYPVTPAEVEPHNGNGAPIDYQLLAKEVANQMRGVIPAPAQWHSTMDGDGLHLFYEEGNRKVEIKNKRYSMPG